MEATLDEDIRVRGYVPTEALIRTQSAVHSTRIFLCGTMMLMRQWHQSERIEPNIPSSTFLYADPDGYPIGLTHEALSVDILDRDYGWVLFEIETRWGPVEVWADGEW